MHDGDDVDAIWQDAVDDAVERSNGVRANIRRADITGLIGVKPRQNRYQRAIHSDIRRSRGNNPAGQSCPLTMSITAEQDRCERTTTRFRK